MRVFLTGSFDEEIIQEAKAKLTERGHVVTSHTSLMVEKYDSMKMAMLAPEADLLRMDVEYILESEGIALLPDWKDTKIVKVERLLAIRLGLFADDVQAFLDPDGLHRHKAKFICDECGIEFTRGKGRPPKIPLCSEHDYLKASRGRQSSVALDPPDRTGTGYDERISDFWEFAALRHGIYHKRKAGKPPPWTDDPLLSTYQFTNVYRDLDPGTIAFRKWVTKQKGRTIDDVAFWALAYRITNHAEILDRRGLPDRDPKAVSEWVNALLEDERAGYVIQPSTHRAKGWQHMRAALTGACFDDLNISKEKTAEDAWYHVKAFYGFGPFYATQVMSDVLDDETCPWQRDSFLPAALGSTRALLYLSNGEVTKSSSISRKQVITDLDFAYRDLHDSQTKIIDGPLLTYVDIEHTLCEFSKYVGAPHSGGTGRLRVFSPTDSKKNK